MFFWEPPQEIINFLFIFVEYKIIRNILIGIIIVEVCLIERKIYAESRDYK